MKTKTIFLAILFLGIVGMAGFAFAADAPVLNFSDLTGGPKIGLGDSLGEGVIVTIWGNNLGSSQGSSKVYFKDSANTSHEVAYVYYWKNADGQLPGGPADLYTSHKMQEIAFSIPQASADGAGKIYVSVDGVASNELDFTVRNGNIKHVKSSGTNSVGCGAWSAPCQTPEYLTAATGRIAAGDTIYLGAGVQESDGLRIGVSCTVPSVINGTPGSPIAIAAYPGISIPVRGVQNYCNSVSYWTISKMKTNPDNVQEIGVSAFLGGRIIGNEITGSLVTGSSQSGAISGNINMMASGIKAFGNYIHNYGNDSTSKLQHVFYLSNRTGTPMEAYELGWNHLSDNKAHHGLHIYDERVCGDMTGTLKVHDNYVKNQVGYGFDILTEGPADPCFSMPVLVYNNVFINVGQEIPLTNAAHSPHDHSNGLAFAGQTTRSNIKFYNNTLYGYSEEGYGELIFSKNIYGVLGGTLEWKNNIVIDTNDRPYFKTPITNPTSPSNNIWYSLVNPSKTAPPWESSPLTVDPLFVNPAGFDFSLQSSSPAKDTGSNSVSDIVSGDFLGLSRPQGSAFDIGAYEYASGGAEPDVTPPAVPIGLEVQ